MTEGYTTTNPGNGMPYPSAQGPFMSTPEPLDFSGGSVWNFTYDFEDYAPKGKPIKGKVAIPTQARIDKYEQDLTMLRVELDHAARQEQQAIQQVETFQGGLLHGAPNPNFDEAKETVERAFEFKRQVMDKMRDVLADFCGGHPTRKQFDLLPENALIAFNNAIQRKLSPNS